MSSWKQRLKRSAAELLAIPPDTLLEVDRVSCTNGTDVIVENITKLLRVEEHEVILQLKNAELHVQGREFQVNLVTEREVHIHGEVDNVAYHRMGRSI